ncbi:MAG: L-2-amino-thiazoline-4-carboxylic acid hydrolase [Candidatus Thorarchaeota archaeon]
MQVQKYGEYNPYQKTEVQAVEFVERALLTRLNYLLGFLERYNAEVHQKYLEELTLKLETLVQENFVVQKVIDVFCFCGKYENLKEQPELCELVVNYGLGLLNLPNDVPWESQKIEIAERDCLRGFLIGYYQLALALTEIIDRKEAINLLKKQIDQFLHNNARIPKIPDLETARENFIEEAHEGGEVRIISDVHDGKLILRKDTCQWADIMKETNDPELSYVVACYGDFKNCSERNENFVLTRNYTIMEGYPYCDEIIHDSRIVSNLKHPPKEFFDKLWPLE